MSNNTHSSGNPDAPPSKADSADETPMEKLYNASVKLAKDRQARDDRRVIAAQNVQNMAQRGFRPGLARPGVRADAFFLYRDSAQPATETAPDCSAAVLARFGAASPREWATYDGKLCPEDVFMVRHRQKCLQDLVPRNAFALSPAGWNELGYFHLEIFDELYDYFDCVSDAQMKEEYGVQAAAAFVGAKDAFATADRLEYVFAHPDA